MFTGLQNKDGDPARTTHCLWGEAASRPRAGKYRSCFLPGGLTVWSYFIVVIVKWEQKKKKKNLLTTAKFKTIAEESVTAMKRLSLRKTGFAFSLFTWKMRLLHTATNFSF